MFEHVHGFIYYNIVRITPSINHHYLRSLSLKNNVTKHCINWIFLY